MNNTSTSYEDLLAAIDAEAGRITALFTSSDDWAKNAKPARLILQEKRWWRREISFDYTLQCIGWRLEGMECTDRLCVDWHPTGIITLAVYMKPDGTLLFKELREDEVYLPAPDYFTDTEESRQRMEYALELLASYTTPGSRIIIDTTS